MALLKVNRGHRIETMNNNAWQKARVRADLRQVRVHDLKHTFGRRLRAAGVSFEDRQDLLGHRSGRITTHYSAAELQNLLEAANRVCEEKSRKSPALTILIGIGGQVTPAAPPTPPGVRVRTGRFEWLRS
jgi:hypothetical protein